MIRILTNSLPFVGILNDTMVDDDGAKLFPVVFYDGEREMNIGHVRIHPFLDLKTFQSILSQKIGISPNQMSIYLVDGKKPKLAHEDLRKILITGWVSFALIANEKDCFILVVLKPSRRERRRKSKQGNVEFGDNLMGNNFPPAPEKLLLLQRNQPELKNPQFSGFVSPHYNQIAPLEFGSVSDRLQNLEIQRDNYMAMVSNSYLDYFPKIEDRCVVSESPALKLCEGCTNAKTEGKTVPFHCCVNDAVTVAFRSSVGPIARPSR